MVDTAELHYASCKLSTEIIMQGFIADEALVSKYKPDLVNISLTELSLQTNVIMTMDEKNLTL